jgi:NTE family protein
MNPSALVLSGGWALGIAHLGALSALMCNGHTFNWYAWVSAGAIVAAGLAIGHSPEDLKETILQTKILSLAFDLTWNKAWFLSGRKVRSVLETVFGDKTFDDTNFPLTLSATNYETGERLTMNRGFIVDAVEASISVPLLFTPFYHPEYKCYCVDGGPSHNFPVDLAVQNYTGDQIIGIDVNTSLSSIYDEKGELQTLSVADNLQRTFRIFFRNQLIPDDPRITLIRPDLSNFSAVDIFHFEEIWQVGYDSIISPETPLKTSVKAS